MRRLLVGLAGALVSGVLALTPSAAQAETTLCVGSSFKDTYACDPGWAVNMMFMHWRMYRGHNCTNYVAWRLTRDGVAEPPYLLGNANTWASRAQNNGVAVNTTPAVGAVGAWPGRNHIVYVEQVGPGWLMLSEDSYSSQRYRRYTAKLGERGYPTRFIHFRGANTITGATPTVTGTPLVGQVLTANAGVWQPNGVKLAFTWLRNGVIIGGATSTAYRLTPADAGRRISVSITGTYTGRLPRTASSLPTAPVSAGTIKSVDPTISGDPIVGTKLVAVPGTWSPANLTLTYQWFAGGKLISGADEQTWKVGSSRVGKTITVKVTGSGPGLTPVTTESAPTAAVVKAGGTIGAISGDVPRIIQTPTMMVGDRLSVATLNWQPAPVRLVVQWFRGSEPIPGANAWKYTLTPADLGKVLHVEVGGTRANYKAGYLGSANTSPVLERKVRAVAAPTLAGTPLVGQTLTANPGQWSPADATVTTTWLRNGQPIPGATGATYALTKADLGKLVSARFLARRTTFADGTADAKTSGVVRATPELRVRPVALKRPDAQRLFVGAVAFNRTLPGILTIVEGKKEIWRAASQGSTLVWDYVSTPGVHTLVVAYKGPAWAVPVTQQIKVTIPGATPTATPKQ